MLVRELTGLDMVDRGQDDPPAGDGGPGWREATVFGRRRRGEAPGRPDEGAPAVGDPDAALAAADRLRIQASRDGDPILLKRALAAAAAAADAHHDDPRGRAIALSMVCVLNRTLAARTGDPAALAAAVRAGREGYALAEGSVVELRGRCASALATALMDLYQQRRDIHAVDEAVTLSRQTVDGLDPDDEEYVGMLSNLANALMLASQAHRDPDLLNESIVASRSALRELDPAEERFVNISVNLASALLQQGITTMSSAPVREARTLVHSALSQMDRGNPHRATVQDFAARLDQAMAMLGG